ncbi:MAG: class I SAM-dependent methyltransferase [Elusimicrobiota bacterium]|nr:class I SAM-dependent methyltransferase [Elusimicrobiota bacterium]
MTRPLYCKMVKYRMTSKGTDGSEIYWDGRHYDAFNAPVHDDLKFYLAQARKARGPVLELACGTGRLTIPLKKEGIAITGLDQAAPMLERAKAKAAEAGLKIPFQLGDARSFILDRKFKLIFMAFHSMQHLGRREDIEGLFASVARHLAPGGRFVLDVFNPNPHCLVRDPEEMLPVAYYRDPDGGGKILVNETYSYDKAAQVSRITWHYRSEKTGKTVKKSLNLRCFYPEELLALAHYNGFSVAARYGDFRGRPFGGASGEQILILAVR